MIHTFRWCFALARRRGWRWLEAVATDPKVRKTALGKTLGAAGGFLPLLWVLPGSRWGQSQFDAGQVAATATATIWLVFCLPALGGSAITMRRAGLTMVVGGPVDGRGLVAWWMVRAALGMAVFHGVIWALLARRCLLTGDLSARWPALAVACAAATAMALGLVATVVSLHHRLAGRVRAVIGSLVAAAMLIGAVVTIRVAFIGDARTSLAEPWGGLWLALLRSVLDSAGFALTVLADPWTSPSPWPAAGALVALGVATLALGLVAGRSLDVPRLFEASARQAEALAEARRRPRGARRPGRVRPFGTGARALAWKALAERAGRHGRVARAMEWAMLLAAGGLAAWLVTGGITVHHEWVVLAAAALGTIFGSAMGGAHEAGLGTEIHHRTWLLRYPGDPRRLLAVLLVVPWVQGLVVLGVTLGPAFVAAPVHRPLIAVAFAAGGACCAGVRALRAWAWLQFPPEPAPSPLGSLLHFALCSLPLTLAAGTAAVTVAGAGWTLEAGVALAGMPAAVLAGAGWPFAARAFRSLEL